MVSVQPSFIRELITTSEIMDFSPRCMIIDKTKGSPRFHKCSIEELHTKDDNT